MSVTVDLTSQLIAKPSVTPDDAGCQALIAERLKQCGFQVESMRFGDVDNLWARFGIRKPLLVFAGHTDVVPTGPIDQWHSAPFEPTIRDKMLYGRGAADMKSGLSAMIIAAEQFVEKNPQFPGSIAFLITSDEEGPSINGTQKVMETLTARKETIDYCIIGEATSENQLGDQIRVGRRGSLHAKITILGKQGHVAFPELAENPIHLSAKALDELAHTRWDEGNAFFPPTTFQISNIHSGTGAANVIPGTLDVQCNFRFSSAISAEALQEKVEAILEKHHLRFDIEWQVSALPFLTKQGPLVKAVQQAIYTEVGLDTRLSTGGGTSDGRFIAPTGAELVELGPINATVHQVNECVSVEDLDRLTAIYQTVLRTIFAV